MTTIQITDRTVEEWVKKYPWWLRMDAKSVGIDRYINSSKVCLKIINTETGGIIILHSRDAETLDRYRDWEVIDFYEHV